MRPRSAAPQPPVQQELLLSQLKELVGELQKLFPRIDSEVISTAQSYEPNLVMLQRECALFQREYLRYAQVMNMLKESIEKRLEELTFKGSLKFDEPVIASRFQTVMILHMCGEQGMTKRLEELRAIELRKKELQAQYEAVFAECKERFEETAQRLNLLLYMQSSLEKEGALPGNIMYSAKFPQVVQSPFGLRDIAARLRDAGRMKTNATPVPVAEKSAGPPSQEEYLEELAKRRELLLQMRAQAKLEREQAKQEK